MIKQLSVFLENRPGRLANLLNILESHNIKVLAMGIAEAGNYGIVRLIVDRKGEALEVLRGANMAVNETNVIAINLNDLSSAVRTLGDANINIDYAYTMDCQRVILKVNNEVEAIKALSGAGIKALEV
ncbi:MAG: acetolactate synthase [Candidatus Methanomethyliales bacterium]|nr:acetolactate synthase [Candidatus Methanomethylicales archaeon]